MNAVRTSSVISVAPQVTEWINGRAACEACGFVGWVIHHPEAEVVCPKCGGPMIRAVGDEYKTRLYGTQP